MWFAILLNFKHIYMYMAPVYVVYLMRAYCLTVSSIDGVHTPWYSFSFTNLSKLGATVITVFAVSFGPFIHQIPQVMLVINDCFVGNNYYFLMQFYSYFPDCFHSKEGCAMLIGLQTSGHCITLQIKRYLLCVSYFNNLFSYS